MRPKAKPKTDIASNSNSQYNKSTKKSPTISEMRTESQKQNLSNNSLFKAAEKVIRKEEKSPDSNLTLSKPITNTKIPAKGESFFATDTAAKKQDLPNDEEREFARAFLGNEAESKAYNNALLETLGYKQKKTERELFIEGLTGKESDDIANVDSLIRQVNGADLFKKNQKQNEIAERQKGVTELLNQNVKIMPTPQADYSKQWRAAPTTKYEINANKSTSESPVFVKDPKGTVGDIWGNAKEFAADFKEDPKGKVKDIWDFSKSAAKNLVNDASSWANEKGFFDDATNAFFKAYDASREFPIKILPTDALHQSIADENYKENQKIDLSKYDEDGGYINDQNIPGSQVGKLRYGSDVFRNNGCEIIAVNNALVSLDDGKDIRAIAKEFETNGQTAFGYFGTSPFAIGEYFEKQGYQVETFTGDKEIYNLDIPDADTYIISFWNTDEVTSMIHTVSMDKFGEDKYRIYNVGGSTKEIDSLNDYFLEENRVPLVLHCIKKGR